ncbi:multiple inositol polyphosphate phosphatase 1-like [Palaemon carinicauda]|uniref:multiple inositol polyphosphate phosphatase 1-like n=1 Tax=Palaemon carinicauda TaxID=392227 RepID=UPI0035B67950
MKGPSVFVIFSLILCCFGSPLCEDVNDETPIHRLSTKTSYFNAEKDNSNWETFQREVSGCIAHQVWLLNRHGTRFPTGNDMSRLVDVLPTISKQIVSNHHQGRVLHFTFQFYKACPRWMREVYKNNETTYKERLLFVKGKEFQSVIHTVSARLGFLHPLTPRQIESIYDECRYETAWWPNRKSAWCSSFSHHDFEVMEYHQDLKYYYEDSYGQPLNLETACETMNNIYSNFWNTVISGKGVPHGIFNFAHDKTILQVLTRLGIFKPSQHLRHDNFSDMKNRIWKTSYVSPFAANLALVLYSCGSDHKVGTFFQGQPIPIPGKCEGVSCRWEELQPWFENNFKTCDLSKLCMIHDEL